MISVSIQGAYIIAVKMFPDYVQRMTEEDEDGNCMLAREYWVNITISIAGIILLLKLLTLSL